MGARALCVVAAAALLACVAAEPNVEPFSTEESAAGVMHPLTTGNLNLLPLETEAACLDGSPYGFYFNPSTSGDTRWNINIQGGGWCYNETLCFERSKTRLGTSTVWPKTAGVGCNYYDANGTGIEGCNSAFLPYGDGASFSGYRKEAFPVSQWPPFDNGTYHVPPGSQLWFRGIRNLDATLDALFERGLGKCTELVVTGGSAGGLSTFLHMDRIASRVHAVNPHCKVRGMPVVGYFLDHDNEVKSSNNYTAWMRYITHMQNLTTATGAASTSGGGLMPACVQHYAPMGETYKCFMAPYAQAFVQTPYFMLNSRFDAWQMENILQSPCEPHKQGHTCTATEAKAVVQYGADFLTEFAPVPASHGGQNGAFITSCICHGCPWGPDLVLDGLNTYAAFAKWYAMSTQATGELMNDDDSKNAHVYIDHRGPNADGTLKNSKCSVFP